MPLRYVLDEHLRRHTWMAVRRHNAHGTDSIDVVRVGDPPDLPLGTNDPVLLRWAEREGRLIVTRDRTTMSGHLSDHLQAGHHSPGIFVIRPNSTLSQVIAFLVYAAYTSDPSEWHDGIDYIP
jgi:hypothetical protein